jgi:hypothetical protein
MASKKKRTAWQEKFIKGFVGTPPSEKSSKDDYNSPEAKKKRALSRARKKAAGTW